MANALVQQTGPLPTFLGTAPAAQYVRMSTDHQRYSTANQIAVISAYAAQHDMKIVRTYQDEGRSGLQIHGRQGLKDLIADVVTGRADFERVLVYDVSRWGRFQDADESAHYEFICKQAGVKVEYCAEDFANDGSFLAALAKQVKRTMAGEYSRELSNKVFAAQCRLVKLGYRQGGPPGYGLRRKLINEEGTQRGILQHGQRKYLQTDRVLLVPGPEHELAVIREVFRQCVLEDRSDTQIARDLNSEGIENRLGHPWTNQSVRYLLHNENYIGTLVYNRKTVRLRSPQRHNSPSSWIRVPGVFPAIVDPDLFRRAQEIKRQRRLKLSAREMLARLESLYREKGRLSATIVDESDHTPHSGTYMRHFGSLENAYRLIKYNSRSNPHPVDSDVVLTINITNFANELISTLEQLGHTALYDPDRRLLTIDGGLTASVYVARCLRSETGWLRWAVRRRVGLNGKWIIALRMDLGRARILDYLLLPVAGFPKQSVEFSFEHPGRLEACRFETTAALTVALWQAPRITFGRGRPKKAGFAGRL